MAGREVVLVQPRHIYAPPAELCRKAHVYMPTSLLTAASRLIEAGVSVSVHDENIDPDATPSAELLGINLLGAPYIERGREFAQRLSRNSKKGVLALGGQVIAGFSREEIRQLFGSTAVSGNNDGELANAFGFDVRALRPPEETSLVPAYETLSDSVMREYFAGEFGFYLSQGCKFSCTFCAANRSRLDPSSRAFIRVGERYRKVDVVTRDLMYLADRALGLHFDRLQLYLSNLDLFQSPDQLGHFTECVNNVRRARPGFRFEMRGLSTVASFLDVHRAKPEIIERLVEAGLHRVGFGIDGATAVVFQKTHKPQRREMCDEAIRMARVEYGLTPETLMVFGHVNIDTEESLACSRDFTRAMLDEYGACPRPHVAKSAVPGNDGWNAAEWKGVVDVLLANPHLFQTLDFTALPSTLTHPDAEFRDAATKFFIEVCELGSCITRYVRPEEPSMGETELAEVRRFNEGRYDI